MLQAIDNYYTSATATADYVGFFFYIILYRYVLINVTIKLVMILSYKLVQTKCCSGIGEY